MKRKDPLFRSALQIHRLLTCQSERQGDEYSDAALSLMDAQAAVELAWRRVETARRHGWHLAAGLLRSSLVSVAQELQREIAWFLQRSAPAQHQSPPPRLINIIEELTQLQEEFEHVEILPDKGLVVARTDSIELEEVVLGPFAIELHIQRLGRSLDSGCFDCTALQPNPAASNPETTHPHVQAKAICAGDGTAAINRALKQGRISDAFCLMRSVLQTYNPYSPYVALDSWWGTPCPDCGCSISDDERCSCHACDSVFCSDCLSSCDICEQSTCTDCLERDGVTRRQCCPNCRDYCERCQRTVESGRFDSETELCEDCAAEANEENEETEETEPIDSEEQTQPILMKAPNHEQLPSQPVPQPELQPEHDHPSPGTQSLAPVPIPATLQPEAVPGQTDPGAGTTGISQAPVLPARRRQRNRRLRPQPPRRSAVC